MSLRGLSQVSSNAIVQETESFAVTSHCDSVQHLVSALEACARLATSMSVQ